MQTLPRMLEVSDINNTLADLVKVKNSIEDLTTTAELKTNGILGFDKNSFLLPD